MINRVILVGNLGQDPEVRHLENGKSVAKLTLATSGRYKDKEDEWQTLTEWHNITAWGRLAETIEKHYKKGMQVYVEGKIKTDKYQDKDGNDRYITKIVANTIRRLGSKDSNEQSEVAKPGSDSKGEDDLPF